jgi:hypothetical protein
MMSNFRYDMNMIMSIKMRRFTFEHFDKHLNLCSNLALNKQWKLLIPMKTIQIIKYKILTFKYFCFLIHYRYLFKSLRTRTKFSKIQMQSNTNTKTLSSNPIKYLNFIILFIILLLFMILSPLLTSHKLFQQLALLFDFRWINDNTHTRNIFFPRQFKNTFTPLPAIPIIISINNNFREIPILTLSFPYLLIHNLSWYCRYISKRI